VEVGPDVCAAPSAGRAGEARFDVRQPNLIRPAVGAQRYAMAAMVVGAVDEHAAHAHLAQPKVIFWGRMPVSKRLRM
jgi:hypothetical protein